MSEFSISAKNLGKRYSLGETPSLLQRLPMRRRNSQVAPPADFWALEDVSFDIKQGEAVGVIGRNGAGKSTLLKVLSRITEPTRGHAEINGRLASLLEVGTGFHPELTGRENVYMNGSILGMRKSEISRSFDEIITFAGIEKFVDTPVKRYSSGMYVRLAFAVAAHLEPEILIIDEVLAVGDVQFQKKCLGKMEDVRRSGRTVLFVSHNMTAVRELTTRCILLKSGSVQFDGSSDAAISLYSEAVGTGFLDGEDLDRWPRAPFNLTSAVRFRELTFSSGSRIFESEDTIEFAVTVQGRDALSSVRVYGTIFEAEGTPVGTFFSSAGHHVGAGERKRFKVSLDHLRLGPGNYYFCMGLATGHHTSGYVDHDVISDVLPFEISGVKGEGGTVGTWYKNWGKIRFDSPPMLPA